jgi:hypothetical protein
VCRSIADGGRRCPCDYNPRGARERQRRSRATRGLAAARASGDAAEIAKASKKYLQVFGSPPAAAPIAMTTTTSTVTAPVEAPTPAVLGEVTATSGPLTTEDRIRAAYEKLATDPSDYVSLTDLRRECGDVSKAEFDAALLKLNQVKGVTLAPEENQKTLTAEDRDAALRLGTQAVHLLTIEPTAASVTGAMSDKPLIENGWGDPRNDEINYHSDGVIGEALQHMGADARMDVDGEPLANVAGRIATDVVTGRRTAQDGVDAYKALRDRLPQDSQAREHLDRAIWQMDAPRTAVPDLPSGTPEPLQTLVRELHAVPLVRRDPATELEPLLALADDAASGRLRGPRLYRAVQELRGRRHESQGDAGKFEVDRALEAAVNALRPRRA